MQYAWQAVLSDTPKRFIRARTLGSFLSTLYLPLLMASASFSAITTALVLLLRPIYNPLFRHARLSDGQRVVSTIFSLNQQVFYFQTTALLQESYLHHPHTHSPKRLQPPEPGIHPRTMPPITKDGTLRTFIEFRTIITTSHQPDKFKSCKRLTVTPIDSTDTIPSAIIPPKKQQISAQDISEQVNLQVSYLATRYTITHPITICTGNCTMKTNFQNSFRPARPLNERNSKIFIAVHSFTSE